MTEQGKLTQDELDALLGERDGEAFQFTELEPNKVGHHTAEDMNLDLLLDIPLEIVVELGRTKKKISEVLELTSGSIVELDKMAGEPVDVYINNKLIAIGEVVVIDEHFGVRIKEIIQSPVK
ncbi:flagellar motor switch protein FliN [Neobacillus notoginsengisoli]|uniref:Flagellar motor switch protein FliN n=1 Tax=Neobacillus notoginsengisoli TaxID=1578198 RepID=A0A417YJH9_9BACI|nr:flagellar motor switch protein FliN [Neobacillus notoginsengisoli]